MTRISKKTPASATAAFGCGLVILTASVLLVPMNLRDASILINRADFVRDEFHVDYFSQGRKSQSLGGHVESTGESLSTSNDGIILEGGLARRRELLAQKRLVDHRFPIWYLPANGFWRFVDNSNQFRVLSPEQFEASDQARWAWLGVGAAFYITGALLLRWGVLLARRGAAV